MARILVVDDETLINQLIAQNLKLVGYYVEQAFDGKEALKKIESNSYDLVILDIMLPAFSGFEVIQKIKDKVPVIFVSAKTQLQDRIEGLQLGAEDYLTKPFEMLELLTRVQVVLRRNKKEDTAFTYKKSSIDFKKHKVIQNQKEIAMTPKEFDLLNILIMNRNIALTREKLLFLVWGYDYEGDTRTVDIHIQRIRKKLHWEKEIKTIYKLGYRLELEEDEND